MCCLIYKFLLILTQKMQISFLKILPENALKFVSKKMRICVKNFAQLHQYIEAVNKLGKLEQDECFGYVPLLGLGGSEKIQNLKKVKIREYIELISQLVGKIGM